MSLRDDLPAILARDSRYTLSAYIFVFEALEFARRRKLAEIGETGTLPKPKPNPKTKKRSRGGINHVSGGELSLGARDLAIERFGFLARTVLAEWGVRSTSDFGEIVYALIEAGELRKTASDSRADFDDVYDFGDAFDKDFVVPTDALVE